MAHGKGWSFNDLSIYNLHVNPKKAGCLIYSTCVSQEPHLGADGGAAHLIGPNYSHGDTLEGRQWWDKMAVIQIICLVYGYLHHRDYDGKLLQWFAQNDGEDATMLSLIEYYIVAGLKCGHFWIVEGDDGSVHYPIVSAFVRALVRRETA
jgi:hypothetical protein